MSNRSGRTGIAGGIVGLFASWLRAGLVPVLGLLFSASAQTTSLTVDGEIRTASALTNTVVRIDGRSELRLDSASDPLPGSTVDLGSPDAWLRFESIPPSRVASSFLGRIRVRGAAAVRDRTVRVVPHAQGSWVIPHGTGFEALELHDGRHFSGSRRGLTNFAALGPAQLGVWTGRVASIRLRRGYMATLAQRTDGTGVSRCYVAQDADVEIPRLPQGLENDLRFVRVFPWRWTSKKGVAGNIESGLATGWGYNWNIDRNSTADWEYVPIRQTRWWPGLDQDWRTRGATHLLGFNEPDRPDQANMTVADALAAWPELMSTGLRLGAPAVSDGGLGWLYDFIDRADAAGLRVDFVPVHYYRCFGNPADAAGTANQFRAFLQDVHARVRRPLWITEWNNGANWTQCADPTAAQQAAAIAAIVAMLDGLPFVERYAVYNWVEDVRRVVLDNGTPTAAGVAYREARSPVAHRQRLPDSGTTPVVQFGFDGDRVDDSANGLGAAWIGNPRQVAGRVGEAVSFDGVDDHVVLPENLGRSTDFSFAAWARWDGGAAWQRIFDLGLDTTRHLFLTPRSGSGTLRFALNTGSGEQTLDAPALTAGVWTHVAVSVAGNTGKLWVNGLPVATNTTMTANPVDVGARNNFLGRSQFPADPLFRGRLDDVRFGTTGLSDAAVSTLSRGHPPRWMASWLRGPDALPGAAYSSSLAGSATGTGLLRFEKLGGPAWLTVDGDGTFRGTVPADAEGDLRFRVRVVDAAGAAATADLRILVGSVTRLVAAPADDAIQQADGTVRTSDVALPLGDASGSGAVVAGLRFRDLPIPPNAAIETAEVRFKAAATGTGTSALRITTAGGPDAGAFTPVHGALGVRSDASLGVPWSPPEWSVGETGPAQTTPNLAALLESVVAREDWAEGGAWTVFLTGTGNRSASAFESLGFNPARLSVRFRSRTPETDFLAGPAVSADTAVQSVGGNVFLNGTTLALGGEGTWVGLRFPGIPMPQGAEIVSAHIRFGATAAGQEPGRLTIWAEATDSSPVFAAVSGDLGRRERTVRRVDWDPPAWPAAGARGTAQVTSDLSGPLQEVLDRPGWAAGGAVTFLVTGPAALRLADSAQRAGGFPPQLEVRFRLRPARDGFRAWATAHGVSPEPQLDADGDGIGLLREFLLGLDPATPEPQPMRVRVVRSDLELTFPLRAGIAGAQPRVEGSETPLGPWTTDGLVRDVLSDDGATREWRWRRPLGAAASGWIRWSPPSE